MRGDDKTPILRRKVFLLAQRVENYQKNSALSISLSLPHSPMSNVEQRCVINWEKESSVRLSEHLMAMLIARKINPASKRVGKESECSVSGGTRNKLSRMQPHFKRREVNKQREASASRSNNLTLASAINQKNGTLHIRRKIIFNFSLRNPSSTVSSLSTSFEGVGQRGAAAK